MRTGLGRRERCLLALATALGCRPQPLTQVAAKVTVAPATLSLSAYLGASARAAVTATNSGQAADALMLQLSGSSAFALEGPKSQSVGAGRSVSVAVAFAPSVVGSSTAVLEISDSAGKTAIALTGTALADLACPDAGPCALAAFDADAGSCTRAPLADGTLCALAASCVVAGQCLEGQCLGAANPCDDGNACTRDFCLPGQGCQHPDISASCKGYAPCQLFGCDPQSGCTVAAQADGTPCASSDVCQIAQTCQAGACQGVPVPDGQPCQVWWEPCVSDATCRAGSCDSPTADAEQPGDQRWRLALGGARGPLTIDDGGTSLWIGNLLTDAGPLEAALVAVDACGAIRWLNAEEAYVGAALDENQAIAWTEDQEVADNGQVVLVQIDLGSGKTVGRIALIDNLLAQASADGISLQQAAYAYAPVFSNQGVAYVLLVSYDGQQFPYEALLALDRAGATLWGRQVPFAPQGESLGVDAAGDVFLVSSQKLLLALDATGKQLFNSTLPQVATVAGIGAGELFLSPGPALLLDGGQPIGTLPALAGDCSGHPVAAIGAEGDVLGNFEFGFAAVRSDGTPRWSRSDAIFTSQVLAEDGGVFALSGCGAAGVSIAALDGVSGATRWQANISPAISTASLGYGLGLTPTGTLLTADVDGVTATFAGQERPARGGPWLRYRGDARNRGSVAVP